MELNQEQSAKVAEWFAAGATLDEIQKRIQAEFSVHLTYLEVRMMVASLPQPAEPEAPAPAESQAAANADNGEGVMPAADAPVEAEMAGAEAALNDAGTLPPPAGSLEVSVDPLAPPSCIACGSVTFSDGVTGKWMLDQMGRLGLSGLEPGYRPPAEDNAEFQPKLVAALRARGLM